MTQYLTICYTINDPESFEDERKKILDQMSSSKCKPWAITAISFDHEMYPENDNEYQDEVITSIDKTRNGWKIDFKSGFSFFLKESDCSLAPEVGMIARFYGKGVGFSVRGLFLWGNKVFYRTEAEDSLKREEDLYGKNAGDWVERWDNGKSIWSIEMGGLGPGYEQCIQVMAVEFVRSMMAGKYDASKWVDSDAWVKDREEIETMCKDTINKLSPSGAQFGAALNLASFIYKDGPINVMNDEKVKDRHIQASKSFPSLN